MGQVSAPIVDWAVANATLPGQTESGDRALVRCSNHNALVTIVDGVGHGSEAATAARLAVETIERSAGDQVISLVRACHERLRPTRGVVMSVVLFDPDQQIMTWIGVGNVEGVLLRANPHTVPAQETLLLRGGVVGAHLPPLLAATIPVAEGDMLILATDGIRSGFAEIANVNDRPQQLADRILARYWSASDDALVLVASYLGG